MSFDIKMGLAQEYALRFRYKNEGTEIPRGHWTLQSGVDGRLVAEGDISFPPTPQKFKIVSTTTGTFVNAGSYRLVVSGVENVEFVSNVENIVAGNILFDSGLRLRVLDQLRELDLEGRRGRADAALDGKRLCVLVSKQTVVRSQYAYGDAARDGTRGEGDPNIQRG